MSGRLLDEKILNACERAREGWIADTVPMRHRLFGFMGNSLFIHACPLHFFIFSAHTGQRLPDPLPDHWRAFAHDPATWFSLAYPGSFADGNLARWKSNLGLYPNPGEAIRRVMEDKDWLECVFAALLALSGWDTSVATGANAEMIARVAAEIVNDWADRNESNTPLSEEAVEEAFSQDSFKRRLYRQYGVSGPVEAILASNNALPRNVSVALAESRVFETEEPAEDIRRTRLFGERIYQMRDGGQAAFVAQFIMEPFHKGMRATIFGEYARRKDWWTAAIITGYVAAHFKAFPDAARAVADALGADHFRRDQLYALLFPVIQDRLATSPDNTILATDLLSLVVGAFRVREAEKGTLSLSELAETVGDTEIPLSSAQALLLDPEHYVMVRETTRELVGRLTEAEYETFVLLADGYEFPEIAQVRSESVAAARKRVYRARQRLA